MRGAHFLITILLLSPAFPVWGEGSPPLMLAQTIPLSGVEGRIDHLALDSANQRLFLAALGNDTVEVIDLKAGKRVQTIRDLHEPQGVLFVENKLLIASGQGGDVNLLDGASFKHIETIHFSDDADNLRYDSADAAVYVGYGAGALGLIDLKTLKRSGDIFLGGHPESFQLESLGRRIFVNLPPDRIAVVDKQDRKIIAKWSLIASGLSFNYPMALDETHHRLFIASRIPARLVVFDSESGKVVAKLSCAGDPDDIFYDQKLKRIYVSGGDGSISIFEQTDADHYRLLSNVLTADGARTSLFDPKSGRLYLAVPHRGKQPAEVRVYATQPETIAPAR